MRFNLLPPSLLSLLTVTLVRPTTAGLIPDLLDRFEDLQSYVKRCENPCGYYGQLCCTQGEYCYTDNLGQAQCGSGSAQTQAQVTGVYTYYTTTYVLTNLQTVTSTWSSLIPTVTATAISCQYDIGQSPCGNVCCNSGQFCQQAGICAAVGGSSGYYSGLATVTVTDTAGAPLRPTSNSVTTLTSTGTATTTVSYQTPVGTNGAVLTGAQETSGGGGLSGGAIAGIVIGVIAGIILLFLICACCCFKGLIDGILDIFGLGGRRRRRTEEVEVYEERHHHGGRTWYGANRPSGGTVVEEKRKKDSGLGGFAKAGIFLGGLAAILGLKRRHDERKDDKSNSGYSYYDSEYYSESE
jgi:hypothetical protein